MKLLPFPSLPTHYHPNPFYTRYHPLRYVYVKLSTEGEKGALGRRNGDHLPDAGTNTPGTVGLTQADLDQVIAAVLQIGSATAGTINVSEAISSTVGWDTLTLVNNAAVTEAPAGSLTMPNLRVGSAGPVTLAGVNNVGLLAADATSAYSFNDAAHLLDVSAVDGDTGIAGSAIHLIADALDITQPLSAGSGIVDLEPFTSNRSIDLGTKTIGTLGLTGAELDEITAGVLRIGSSSFTGNVTVSAAINDSAANWNTLSLISGGMISETDGALVVSNLAVHGAKGVVLDNLANQVTALAGTTASAQFVFADSSSVAIVPVDGINNINAGQGNVTLVVVGSISSGSPAKQNDVLAAGLTVIGTTGIGSSGQALKLAVTTLSAQSANANIFLAETGTASLTGAGLSAGAGTITLTRGIFGLTANNQIDSSSTLEVSGATLNLGTFSDTIAALAFTSTSTLTGRINSFAAGHFASLTVNGTISLGNAHLSLTLGAGFTLPPAGTAIVLIDNTSNSPVQGQFAGLPDKATLVVGGHHFRLSYTAAGFDVTFTSLD